MSNLINLIIMYLTMFVLIRCVHIFTDLSFIQGWPTVDTCPRCGLTSRLWSTTTSSPQTDHVKHQGDSAKRCGASTRKTARWVLLTTNDQATMLKELHPRNENMNPPPPSLSRGDGFKTRTSPQISQVITESVILINPES